MTTRWQCVSFLLLTSLLIAIGNCQLVEVDGLSPIEGNTANNQYYDEETDEDSLLDYVDNRIDASPTFVSPVEKFIKAFVAPFDWLSNSGRSSSESRGAVGQVFTRFTTPIRSIVGSSSRGSQNEGGFGRILNRIGDRFKAIYPGTEWCGAGNNARNSEEVGLFKKTDSCCREHDYCNSSIAAGATDHGLHNNGIYTRSHCLCDATFYYCLKETNTIVANNIGLTYFNVLRPQCFKEEYPAHCMRYEKSRLRNNKCLEYEYDYRQKKTWQWFDTPDFL